MSRYYKFAELFPEDNDDLALSEGEGDDDMGDMEESEDSEADNEARSAEASQEALSKFNSSKDTILGKIKNMISYVPFAAELLSLYFYVLDTSQMLAFRAIVATLLLVTTGALAGEVGSDLVTGILLSTGIGAVAAPFVQAVTKALEAGTLVAAIPALIVVYETLVDDKHVEQAEDFLKSAAQEMDRNNKIRKIAAYLGKVGLYDEASKLARIAQARSVEELSIEYKKAGIFDRIRSIKDAVAPPEGKPSILRSPVTYVGHKVIERGTNTLVNQVGRLADRVGVSEETQDRMEELARYTAEKAKEKLSEADIEGTISGSSAPEPTTEEVTTEEVAGEEPQFGFGGSAREQAMQRGSEEARKKLKEKGLIGTKWDPAGINPSLGSFRRSILRKLAQSTSSLDVEIEREIQSMVSEGEIPPEAAEELRDILLGYIAAV